MSAWRRIAIERMPVLRRKIAEAAGPYGVWTMLRCELNRLCENDSTNDALIAAIYGYGNWCIGAAINGDLASAALVCFYEHLPTDPPLRADVGRWLSVENFDGLKAIFGYHLSEDEVQEFRQEFLSQKKRLAEGKPLISWKELAEANSPKKRRKAASSD